MATSTTNFGWDIPQSTDLVKDGATAIAALGQDIDTAMVDLKGGTTGQVLAKASGTDLDFSWVAQDDSNAIQNAIVDAKGDLISATAADTPARLAVGTNGQVLVADSTTATGLAWASAPSGLNLVSTTSFTSVASQSIPSVFSASYTNYKILLTITASTATALCTLRLRSGSTDNSTAGNYLYQNFQLGGITNSDALAQGWSNTSATSFIATQLVTNAGFQNRYSVIEMLSPFETFKTGYTADFMGGNGAPHDYANKITGRMDVTTSYDGFSIIAGSGNITGKVSVYGYNI